MFRDTTCLFPLNLVKPADLELIAKLRLFTETWKIQACVLHQRLVKPKSFIDEEGHSLKPTMLYLHLSIVHKCICCAANPLRTFLSTCDPGLYIMHNVKETEKAHLMTWKECFNTYCDIWIFLKCINDQNWITPFYLGI